MENKQKMGNLCETRYLCFRLSRSCCGLLLLLFCFYLFILHLLPSWKYFIAYTQRVTLDNVHTLYIYAVKIVFCSLFIAVISPIVSFDISPRLPFCILLEFNQAFCIFILCFCFHSESVYKYKYCQYLYLWPHAWVSFLLSEEGD